MREAAEYPPSPVPSDRRLWPGELPFTAFGQYGPDRLDVRVFDQDQWWVDRHGHEHLIADMSREYLLNVITHLLHHADQYFTVATQRAVVQALGDLLLFGDAGDDDRSLSGVASRSMRPPATARTRLEATPLMRELRRQAHLRT